MAAESDSIPLWPSFLLPASALLTDDSAKPGRSPRSLPQPPAAAIHFWH